MKKENVVKKVLLKSLVGFTVGVTLLMIAYVSVYFVAGEDVFVNEIAQLQDVKILISQILFIGLAYYLLFIVFHILLILQEELTENRHVVKYHYKYVVATMSSVVVVSLINIILLEKTQIYSENIGMLNIIIVVIVYALAGLYVCIRNSMQSPLIKKINQKLKERNS